MKYAARGGFIVRLLHVINFYFCVSQIFYFNYLCVSMKDNKFFFTFYLLDYGLRVMIAVSICCLNMFVVVNYFHTSEMRDDLVTQVVSFISFL